MLAARGVAPSADAIAGAEDEVEHRMWVRAFIEGLAQVKREPEQQDKKPTS